MKKFNQCMIDSISFVVRADDTPFMPYIKATDNNNPYEKSMIVNTKVPIKIVFKKFWKSYEFLLQDMTLLRKNNYTNAQVIQYLCNFIMVFFNLQITIAAFQLNLIDLCRVVRNDDEMMKKLLDDKIRCRRSRLDNKGEKVERFTLDTIDEGTVYFNFMKDRSFTLAVFHPFEKENKNRYFNKDVTKLEFRLKGKAIEKKYAFAKGMNSSELLEGSRRIAIT